MTLQESEKRRTRLVRLEDDEEEYRPRRYQERRAVPETIYTFRSTKKPRPPKTVHAKHFKLGDIVSTSEGPHRVQEVFWRSGTDRIGWRADVLLKPLNEDELPEEYKTKHQKLRGGRGRDQRSKKTNKFRKAYGG